MRDNLISLAIGFALGFVASATTDQWAVDALTSVNWWIVLIGLSIAVNLARLRIDKEGDV